MLAHVLEPAGIGLSRVSKVQVHELNCSSSCTCADLCQSGCIRGCKIDAPVGYWGQVSCILAAFWEKIPARKCRAMLCITPEACAALHALHCLCFMTKALCKPVKIGSRVLGSPQQAVRTIRFAQSCQKEPPFPPSPALSPSGRLPIARSNKNANGVQDPPRRLLFLPQGIGSGASMG